MENDWLKGLKLHFIGKYNINDIIDEPYYVNTYAFIINKESTTFDGIIIDIAEEKFDGNILFYCTEKNQYSFAIAPYPGGVDIFSKNKDLMIEKISSLNIPVQ